MKFFSVAPVLAAVAFGAASVVAQGATAIANGINQVTQLSASSTHVKHSLSGLQCSEYPVGQVLINDFQNIVNTVVAFTDTLSDAKPLGDADAQLVVAALTQFVKVHQALLNTVIGKHSLAAQFFVTAQIAAILRTLEGGIDTFAFDLIALIPTQSDSANTQFSALHVTISNAITVYSN
ncbi:hypothetical protein BN946_scf184940.g13 [Trametes cinnabarina]|uniref:Uncharacterized protein n=1 Tax=Pycnoporus cinnabarinus TaxID=5643 RepID=A0A060SCE2_PYCCI|nr:hypothetical protein BN946_scf184940.g13 [Trametes cinnabarina]